MEGTIRTVYARMTRACGCPPTSRAVDHIATFHCIEHSSKMVAEWCAPSSPPRDLAFTLSPFVQQRIRMNELVGQLTRKSKSNVEWSCGGMGGRQLARDTLVTGACESVGTRAQTPTSRLCLSARISLSGCANDLQTLFVVLARHHARHCWYTYRGNSARSR